MVFFSVSKETKQPESVVSLASKDLAINEYNSLLDTLTKQAQDKNPKMALTVLKEKIKKDDRIGRSCHALTHEIGRYAYKKYHNFGQAMKYQDEICNSGYLHGVIESSFANSPDIFAALQTTCDSYSPKSFIGWECFHGIGHGLMYFTQNVLPRSLALCETLQPNEAKSACINGVFMENFNTDQKLHPSRYLKSTDPFYPCPGQKTQYKTDCYLYSPAYYLSLHRNNYNDAFIWCDSAEKNFRQVCVTGVGSQMMKENITNPLSVEKECNKLATDKRSFCISGMVDLYSNHFGGLKETKELCQKLKTENKNICDQVVVAKEALF